ncbi:hypothetical protein NMY22_g17628 [Coprinellus aureogranulatus]|nr:hypothetical protein NMY22_g17628 [Coprinellus aureogranulatus]
MRVHEHLRQTVLYGNSPSLPPFGRQCRTNLHGMPKKALQQFIIVGASLSHRVCAGRPPNVLLAGELVQVDPPPLSQTQIAAMATMPSTGRGPIHMFSGAHNQAFESADIRNAGRDMYNSPTVTVNIAIPAPGIPATSPDNILATSNQHLDILPSVLASFGAVTSPTQFDRMSTCIFNQCPCHVGHILRVKELYQWVEGRSRNLEVALNTCAVPATGRASALMPAVENRDGPFRNTHWQRGQPAKSYEASRDTKRADMTLPTAKAGPSASNWDEAGVTSDAPRAPLVYGERGDVKRKASQLPLSYHVSDALVWNGDGMVVRGSVQLASFRTSVSLPCSHPID